MIVLSPNPTFDAPVKLSLPGSADQVDITFTFKALSRERTISFLILARAFPKDRAPGRVSFLLELAKLCWRMKKLATVVDLCDEIVAGWETGEKGFDIPYSKTALQKLLEEFPGAALAIFVAYISNQAKARRKN